MPEAPPRPAIHQFHAGSALGDGITNAMLFTRRLLHALGFDSEIFCGRVAPALAGTLCPIDAYPDRPGDLLLIHHSFGHDHDAWLDGLQSRKVLVYHNITPDDLFADDEGRGLARRGRAQLAAWRDRVAAAVAVSPYNAQDLTAAGYGDVRVLPLLVDLDAARATPPDPARLAARRGDGAFTVLFVGRLVPHKRQAALLQALVALRGRLDRPARLVLVGHHADTGYLGRLETMIADLGLNAAVELPGVLSDAALAAEYRGCDAYLSLSAHEGFGMPLIEAMAADLPVVAAPSGNVPDTLGGGGLLLESDAAEPAAGALALLEAEPELRRRVILAQRETLVRFAPARLKAALADLLRELGLAVPAVPPEPAPAPAGQPALDLRVEGPFDSSYSLALVNRELAHALARRGRRVGLHATEGGGDYAPDPAFLAANPETAALAHAVPAPETEAAAVLRNCYPPRVDAMPGLTRVLAQHAWEESGYPQARVAAFNRTLNLITVTSRYVAKVLADNGVRVPVAVVGNGADHIRRVAATPPATPPGQGPFRFLHVSSGFPRKGVDVLLSAWGQAFTRADGVSLVLKTFPNPHNDVAEQVAALARRYPDHAEIVHLDGDLEAGALAGLYEACDVLVLPSRGEGFGLPLAEAALAGCPAITTAHGGQRDLCDAETAWLVDYRFARAASHLDLAESLWVEPDGADLAATLRRVRATPAPARAARAAALARRVERDFTWDRVAGRTLAALAAVARRPVPDLPPRTAWVTSWNTRCGIAAYAHHLARRFPARHRGVLASHAGARLGPDGPEVRRCWREGWADDLSGLYAALRDSGAEAAIFQVNFGFFDLRALGRLLERLHAEGVATYLFLHSTADVAKPERRISLREIPTALAGATRLFVHGVADMNRLKDFGHVDNVTLFPHGVEAVADIDTEEAAALRAAHGLTGRRVLASFGYLLPHKGLPELVAAFEQLRESRPDLHLLLLNARYPAPESETAAAGLRDRIARSPHAAAITLVEDYLPDTRARALLSLAEATVFPYQHTQESASGAVRFGLAAGAPVACTPLEIFADVAEVTLRLPGTEPAAIATGLAPLLDDPALGARLRARQRRWCAGRAWDLLSERLWNLLQADRRRIVLPEHTGIGGDGDVAPIREAAPGAAESA